MLRPFAALLLVVAVPAVANAKPPRDPADLGEKASDDKDKMICKRFLETGSLISSHRTCKPKREWERSRANTGTLNAVNSCAISSEGLGC